MIITTTLGRISAHCPCEEGWNKLLDAVKSPALTSDTPINLLTILDSNGVQDMLWALRTVEEQQGLADVVIKLAVAFAREVLPIFEARYPENTQLARIVNQAESGQLDEGAISSLWCTAYKCLYADAREAVETCGKAAMLAVACQKEEKDWRHISNTFCSCAARAGSAAYNTSEVTSESRAARSAMLVRQAEIIRAVLRLDETQL